MSDKVLSEEDREKVIDYYDKGIESFKKKAYEEAIGYFDKTLEVDGQYINAIFYKGTCLGRIEKHREAIDELEKAISIASRQNPKWDRLSTSYNNKAWSLNQLGEFDKALAYFDKALKINNSENAYFNNKGISLLNLFRFEEAIKCFDQAIALGNTFASKNKEDAIYLWLQDLFDNKDYKKAKEIVIEYFCDVLSLLTKLDITDESAIKERDIIARSALDKDAFFTQTTNKNDENIEVYKDIYIQSLKIISLLHIKSDDYLPVAHYTQKSVAEKLLHKDNDGKVLPFRLSTVVTANDPREGKPLLQFLDIDERHASDYSQAFVGSFIFNPDCLNQFRLYGKDNGVEATGVSLVINSDFFNTNLNINKGLINNVEEGKGTDESGVKSEEPVVEKESLFRCIYIDPITKQAISIGHKDNYMFYRDKLREAKRDRLTPEEIESIDREIDEYEKSIKKILLDVRETLNGLKKLIKDDLDQSIICELLTHLRYLAKHVAFKEEQECRVIKVEKLKDSKDIKVAEDKSRMYIDYQTIDKHVDAIFFAPKATGMALFQDLLRREGLDIKCYKSDHPFF